VARQRTSTSGHVRAGGPTDRGAGPPGSHVACRHPSVGFGQQHILARPVGPSTSTTSTSTVGMLKRNTVTYEELTPELIGSFGRTCHHGIRWKGFLPEGALDGVDLSLLSEERSRALGKEVNYMVAHSLHQHSVSLVNALECVALCVIQEIMKNQYSPTRPTLGSHKGELPFQTRPPLPYALAAPESHGAPAYVVYKVGVTLEITSFSTSRLRKFHTSMHAHTYRTAATRYVRFSRRLGEFLGWILISKHGWLSTPPGRAMITHTQPQELKLWIRSAQS
jgi:hypothetical protein